VTNRVVSTTVDVDPVIHRPGAPAGPCHYRYTLFASEQAAVRAHTSTTRPDRPYPPAGVESPAQGEGEDMSISDVIKAEVPGWLSALDD